VGWQTAWSIERRRSGWAGELIAKPSSSPLRTDGAVDEDDKRFGSMTIMHMALGALSSIFGAHLSWALTDWIVERKRSGRPVFWAAAASITGVVVLVVAVGVLLSQTAEV
jgi:hypothetical protein